MAFFRVTYGGGFKAILQAKDEASATKRAREGSSDAHQSVEHLTPHALWMLDEAKSALPVGACAAARRFRSRHLAELAKAARRGAVLARRAEKRQDEKDRLAAIRESERADREAARIAAKKAAEKAEKAAAAKAKRAQSREARRSTTTTATGAP